MVTHELRLGGGGKLFKPFKIVDIITILLFAGMFRDLLMLIREYTFPFPMRHPLWYLACLFCLGVIMAVTRKPGTVFLFTLAWLAIDLFIVHEIYAWLLFLVTSPWIPEYYLFYQAKKQGDLNAAFKSWRDMLMVGGAYTVMAYMTNMFLIIVVVHTPFATDLLVPYGVASLVLGLLGTFLGVSAGRVIARWMRYE